MYIPMIVVYWSGVICLIQINFTVIINVCYNICIEYCLNMLYNLYQDWDLCVHACVYKVLIVFIKVRQSPIWPQVKFDIVYAFLVSC